eukprot:455596-Pelagomonas_calceolata.AAC.2
MELQALFNSLNSDAALVLRNYWGSRRDAVEMHAICFEPAWGLHLVQRISMGIVVVALRHALLEEGHAYVVLGRFLALRAVLLDFAGKEETKAGAEEEIAQARKEVSSGEEIEEIGEGEEALVGNCDIH